MNVMTRWGRPMVLAALGLAAAVAPLSVWARSQAEPPVRMRLRENISNLYLLRLTRALELTEEQTARLYPLLTRVEREKAELERSIGLDLRDLRAELARRAPDEGRVLDLVARIDRARQAAREKDEEAARALDRILTPVQKGRYVVFTADFYRRLGESLERFRGMGAPLKRNP